MPSKRSVPCARTQASIDFVVAACRSSTRSQQWRTMFLSARSSSLLSPGERDRDRDRITETQRAQ